MKDLTPSNDILDAIEIASRDEINALQLQRVVAVDELVVVAVHRPLQQRADFRRLPQRKARTRPLKNVSVDW
ncbi:MAG: hypothetical protein ACPG7P_08580, partial [Candidatus Puniceispirillaceae bacterium]